MSFLQVTLDHRFPIFFLSPNAKRYHRQTNENPRRNILGVTSVGSRVKIDRAQRKPFQSHRKILQPCPCNINLGDKISGENWLIKFGISPRCFRGCPRLPPFFVRRKFQEFTAGHRASLFAVWPASMGWKKRHLFSISFAVWLKTQKTQPWAAATLTTRAVLWIKPGCVMFGDVGWENWKTIDQSLRPEWGSKTRMSWAMNTYSQNAHHSVNLGLLARKSHAFLSVFQRNAPALRVFNSREQWDHYSVMVGLSSLVLMRLVVHLFESQNSWKLLLMVQTMGMSSSECYPFFKVWNPPPTPWAVRWGLGYRTDVSIK